ncbi:type II toxin-antitoxin system prevent-host-death family antitoxin [Acidobacteriota bacterium]
MSRIDIQYIVNKNGHNTAVIVPIDLWEEIMSESETKYLLRSENMRKRLIEAMQRSEGIPFEQVREKLRI